MVRSGRNYGPVTLGRDLPKKKETPKHILGGCPMIVECPFFWMLWGRFYVSVLCVCPSSPHPPRDWYRSYVCTNGDKLISPLLTLLSPFSLTSERKRRKKRKSPQLFMGQNRKNGKGGGETFLMSPAIFLPPPHPTSELFNICLPPPAAAFSWREGKNKKVFFRG